VRPIALSFIKDREKMGQHGTARSDRQILLLEMLLAGTRLRTCWLRTLWHEGIMFGDIKAAVMFSSFYKGNRNRIYSF
jgi:hypothetical protein